MPESNIISKSKGIGDDMNIKDEITELRIMTEVLNSNALLIWEVIATGSLDVSEYEWSLSDLHEKAYDLKEKMKQLENQVCGVDLKEVS